MEIKKYFHFRDIMNKASMKNFCTCRLWTWTFIYLGENERERERERERNAGLKRRHALSSTKLEIRAK
jgi:hypothetical protein